MKVTVKSSMPTGKEDAKFGAEYYLQFNELPDTIPFWFKKQPESDQEMEIEQVNGKWKKVKKEWNPNQKQSTSESTSPEQPRRGGTYKDNSDGMRQGLCINNAAAFVNNQVFDDSLLKDGLLPAEVWAELVHGYATALYNKGDLNDETPKKVEEIFKS